MKVRVRFAPSPTGFIHIGNVYVALLNWAFARKEGGKFVLRIEDTDQKRYVPGAEEKIYQGLAWLGLEPDEGPQQGGNYGPYRQSERLKIYQKYAHQLVEKGKAYYCFCSPERLEKVREERKRLNLPPKYDRHCLKLTPEEVKRRIKKGEKYVIRLLVPEKKEIVVNDLLRGEVRFKSEVIDDQVLLKSDGFPTYHLAVVVDDHLMKISHVIRGEDWLSSTPKHLLLYQYFGWRPPVFVHTPILRNPDRSKLSKRQGHASLSWYQKEGFLPEALLNFLALLGWSHPEEKEVFSLEEFVRLFRLEDISPLGPVFNLEKLIWLNGIYLRQKKEEELANLLVPFLPQLDKEKIRKVVPLIRERIKTLSGAKPLLEFLWQPVKPPVKLLRSQGLDKKEVKKMLGEMIEVVKKENLDDQERLKERFLSLIEKNQWPTGKFFMILRLAICGRPVTPPIVESLSLMAKEEVLTRLEKARDLV